MSSAHRVLFLAGGVPPLPARPRRMYTDGVKTLVLMRHGDADRGRTDHGRPLTTEGQAASRRSAERLLRKGWSPDCVLVSDARRTIETERIVRHVLGSPEPLFDEKLYLASADVCSAAIARVSKSNECVLLIGHNPGISRLASRLLDASIGLSPGEYVSVSRDVAQWSQVVE